MNASTKRGGAPPKRHYSAIFCRSQGFRPLEAYFIFGTGPAPLGLFWSEAFFPLAVIWQWLLAATLYIATTISFECICIKCIKCLHVHVYYILIYCPPVFDV